MKIKIFLTIFFISTFLIFPQIVNAHNVVKDSDFEGITDTKEYGEYKKNHFKAETDEDGYSDYIEIKYKTNPLDKLNKPIIDDKNINVDKGKYFWLFSRASGITAFILLSVGVCFGMGISSRSAYKVLKPPVALEVHNTINTIAMVAVVLHFVALFYDNYFYLKIQEALVPFLIERPFKSELGLDFKIAIGLGILAFYFILILVFTSKFRSKMSIKLWRKIHYLSFFAYITFVFHGISAGSDSHMLWMQAIYAASILGFIIMFIIRIKGVLNKKYNLQDTINKQVPNQNT